MLEGRELPTFDFIKNLTCKDFDENSQRYSWQSEKISAYTSRLKRADAYPKAAYFEIIQNETGIKEFWTIRQYKNHISIIKDRRFLGKLFFIDPQKAKGVVREDDIDFEKSKDCKKIINELIVNLTMAIRYEDVKESVRRRDCL